MGIWGFSNIVKIKRTFQVLFAINILFIGLGIWAFIEFTKTNDLNALALSLVGLGVLIVGIICPLFLMAKIVAELNAISQTIQKSSAQIMTQWLQEKGAFDDDTHNPLFWVNLVLIGLESFGPKSRHPVLIWLGQFAPIIRLEIQKSQIKAAKKGPSKRKKITKASRQ